MHEHFLYDGFPIKLHFVISWDQAILLNLKLKCYKIPPDTIYIYFLLSCIWFLLNGPPWMPCCLSICQTSCFSAQFGELHVWLRRKMTIEKTSWHSGKSILLLNYFFFLLQTCSNSNRCKHNTSICYKTRVTFRIFILNHYVMVYVTSCVIFCWMSHLCVRNISINTAIAHFKMLILFITSSPSWD